MTRTKHRIGLMGGTFDPIHLGHLVTAEAVRNEFDLERILFIPAGCPPHKLNEKVTDARHRYLMTLLATASNPYFSVSAIELERSGPSFTIDTVRSLVKEYGETAELYFITGADAFVELDTWNDIDELLTLCHFVAATRPGIEYSMDRVLAHFAPESRSRIHRLTTPELAISATDIRKRVQDHRSIRYIVPDHVVQYIAKEKLYLS